MKNNVRVILAIAILALAALACKAVNSGEVPEIPTIEVPKIEIPTIEIPTIDVPVSSDSDVILSDDFSSDEWGTGTDADSAVEYVNEALNIIVSKKNYLVWSPPNSESYKDVHMEATMTVNGTDSTTAFGFICDKADANDFYYLVMTPAGQYTIAKAVEGQDDVFLTTDGKWADSDLIAVKADSYRVGADCGNGKLTLYVDGQEIASVEDATYTEGGVAALVWSGVGETATSDISFDDFVMTKLP
jgi:hypothetical protein